MSCGTALNDLEMKHYIPDCQVMRYQELVSDKRPLNTILSKGPIVLLYETKPASGHWTAIFKTAWNTIECFDSYGFEPDEQLSFVPKSYRKVSKQDHTHLIRRLLASGLPVEYNNYRFQKMSPKISTCGRHCIARLAFRHMPIDDYAKMIGFPADSLVTQAIPI